MRRRGATSGMNGTRSATAKFLTRKAGITPISITPARRIWTVTATGIMWTVMDKFGRPTLVLTGLLIKTAVGSGSRTMDGPGFPTNLGAGLRITMAVGFIMKTRGIGGRVPLIMTITIPCGRRPTYHSSDLAETDFQLELVSVRSAGARWARMTPIIHGMDPGSTIPIRR